MKFSYELYNIGWADGYLEVNDQKCYFSVSYLTDALGDLLQNLLQIIPGCVPDDELKKVVTFDWHQEPSGLQWVITLVDQVRIELKIIQYPDMFEKDKEQAQIVFQTTCQLDEFVKEIVNTGELLLKQHGIIGYRDTWYSHDFPLTSYIRLKLYIQNDTYQSEEKKVEWRDFYVSDFAKEVDQLSKLLNSKESD